jgi:hypothetical protein
MFNGNLSSAVPPRTEQDSQIGTIHDVVVVKVADPAEAPVSEQEAEIAASNRPIVIQVSGARRNAWGSSLSNIERSATESSRSP